jgi:hypothetical protein
LYPEPPTQSHRKRAALGVERLGLGFGADVEREWRVAIGRNLAHGAQVLGHRSLDAVPAALLLELDAGVGVAPQHVAAARVVGLQTNEQRVGHGSVLLRAAR